MVLAANGSCVTARRSAKRSKLLTEHNEPEGWKAPVRLLVVDARGRGRTFVIRSAGWQAVRMH